MALTRHIKRCEDVMKVKALTEAFTHALRNAVDHGVEEPDVRIATGGGTRFEFVLPRAMVKFTAHTCG